MIVRRILLLVISLAIGYAATYLIVEFVLGTTVAEFWRGPEEPYNIHYFLLVGFFLALAVGIWLDKFMGTKILPK
jgi:biotin transporter BioY